MAYINYSSELTLKMHAFNNCVLVIFKVQFMKFSVYVSSLYFILLLPMTQIS